MTIESNIVYPPNSQTDPSEQPTGMTRTGPLVTAADIKNTYLWGVKLSDKQGNQIPDAVVNTHIMNSVSYVEHALNITIAPVTFIENKDFRREEYSSWCMLNMEHYPIIDVSKIEIRFIKTQTPTLTFPLEWIRIYSETGQLQLTPTSGTLTGWIVGSNGMILLPGGGLSGYQAFPQLFQVTYKCGFEEGKIPHIINNLISMWTSITILALLANVVISPGITASTISFDGLARASTKTPLVYDALMTTYLQNFQTQLQTAINYYKRITLVVA